MGIWEGVPLRKILWMTQPVKDLRRVFYHGYHNDEPTQLFRSSLSVNRILEDPFDIPPVIVCYKLNGNWLTSERGGPVRMVVPEAYGFKSIKWLNRIVLSNLSHSNDTYAQQNNDVDSPIKTFCSLFSDQQDVQREHSNRPNGMGTSRTFRDSTKSKCGYTPTTFLYPRTTGIFKPHLGLTQTFWDRQLNLEKTYLMAKSRIRPLGFRWTGHQNNGLSDCQKHTGPPFIPDWRLANTQSDAVPLIKTRTHNRCQDRFENLDTRRFRQ